MPRRTLARLLLGVLGVVLLTSCRLDATVELVIGPDGTGTVTVTAVADAEVVQQAPGLAADLRFDDAVAAGWTVEGPTATEDGGLRAVLTHPVTSAAEATNVLNSLGPPFTNMVVAREVTTDGDTTTDTLAGDLVLTGGFDAFADADLLAAVGGTPYADQLAASGATPAGNMAVVLRAELPGEVTEASNGTAVDGARQWEAPLDGSTASVQLQTVLAPSGGGFSSLLATFLLVLLVVWLVAATAFIVSVVRARTRRAQRRRRALSRLR
ncbi:MAG TPA: hypothetical protein VFT09_14085 [Ilumatobacteraceae bacterium]|nr:hypothetical protein [Ilumatobacteraceae bacterium]